MQKYFFSLLLALVLLLAGCSQSNQAQETDMDAAGILQVMTEAASETEDSYFWYEEQDTLVYLELGYGIQPGDVADASIVMPNGASAFELMVLQLSENADQDAAIQRLQQYLLSRQGDFTGYAPDQAALVENGLVLSAGRWLALVICEDPAAVQTAFTGCFSSGTSAVVPDFLLPDTLPDGRLAYIDPDIDDMTIYDTSAILAAWDSGDRSALSGKDAAILTAAEQVLDQAITGSMSDYEKECAVYSWLTGTVVYDWNHYDPAVTTDPDSYNPYGPLLNGKGVCLGYATTFQLLMDLADVECLTVVGASFSSREDHAWNMVRLNGEWYCVDATWDNSSGGQLERCNYFNVTSDYMADTDHQWDYGSIPEATATDGGRP